MSTSILDVQNLTINYKIARRHYPALREFHIRISPGQIYGIVGETGSADAQPSRPTA